MSSGKNHYIISVSFLICILLSINIAKAQIVGATSCTGSLGAPIVNETFGAGSGIASELAPGITNLQYVTYSCPYDGQYTIVNYTAGCFNNTWHSTTDHTGDPYGYFMLVNASYDPSDFFVQTVSGLCDSSSYQFSAWIMNMVVVGGEINPNITFTIEKTDGTILASYSTDSIPVINPATWKQYGFYFTTPAGITTIVLRMHNNAPGGAGNDLALDDIVLRPAGPTATVEIKGRTGDTTSICNSSLQFLSSVQNCTLVNSYQWQVSTDGNITWTDLPGQTDTSYTMSAQAVTGTYNYRLAVAQGTNIGNNTCRINSQPVSVTVYNLKPVFDSAKVIICPGTSYRLPSGKKVDSTGTYVDTLLGIFGCDSLITTVNLIKNNLSTASATASICAGSFYTLPSGKTISTKGIYNDTLYNINGCDSLVTTVNLTVNIAKTATLNVSLCEGTTFTLPSGKIIGISGIYKDTLHSQLGCDSLISTVTLSVLAKKIVNLQVGLCKGNYLTLRSGKRVTTEGTYMDTIKSAIGCDSIVTILSVVSADLPSGFLAKEALKCAYDTLTLTSVSAFENYYWSTGSTARSIIVRDAGTYWLEVTDSNNCVGKGTINVKDSSCREGVFVPSAFTPNGDGKNDLIRPIIFGSISYYRFIIFNRWGEKVFESTDPKKGWDGLINSMPQQIGTYVWQLFLTLNGIVENKKGTVVLIR